MGEPCLERTLHPRGMMTGIGMGAGTREKAVARNRALGGVKDLSFSDMMSPVAMVGSQERLGMRQATLRKSLQQHLLSSTVSQEHPRACAPRLQDLLLWYVQLPKHQRTFLDITHIARRSLGQARPLTPRIHLPHSQHLRTPAKHPHLLPTPLTFHNTSILHLLHRFLTP